MRSGKYFLRSTIWLQPEVFSSITLEVIKKKQKKTHLFFYHDATFLLQQGRINNSISHVRVGRSQSVHWLVCLFVTHSYIPRP